MFFIHKGKCYPQIYPQSVDNRALPQKNNAQEATKALPASLLVGEGENGRGGQCLWKIQQAADNRFLFYQKRAELSTGNRGRTRLFHKTFPQERDGYAPFSGEKRLTRRAFVPYNAE